MPKGHYDIFSGPRGHRRYKVTMYLKLEADHGSVGVGIACYNGGSKVARFFRAGGLSR